MQRSKKSSKNGNDNLDRICFRRFTFNSEYISKDSKRYADRFVEKLFNRVDQLEGFPKAGRIVPEFESESIRELIEGNYRIIYKISIDQIAIVRVHHAARQLK